MSLGRLGGTRLGLAGLGVERNGFGRARQSWQRPDAYVADWNAEDRLWQSSLGGFSQGAPGLGLAKAVEASNGESWTGEQRRGTLSQSRLVGSCRVKPGSGLVQQYRIGWAVTARVGVASLGKEWMGRAVLVVARTCGVSARLEVDRQSRKALASLGAESLGSARCVAERQSSRVKLGRVEDRSGEAPTGSLERQGTVRSAMARTGSHGTSGRVLASRSLGSLGRARSVAECTGSARLGRAWQPSNGRACLGKDRQRQSRKGTATRRLGKDCLGSRGLDCRGVSMPATVWRGEVSRGWARQSSHGVAGSGGAGLVLALKSLPLSER